MKQFFRVVTTWGYLIAALALAGMAFMIMGWSVYEVFTHFDTENLGKGEFISIMLQSVGAIVIAVAIIDVAKYMVEEEVYREKELRSLKEARETLTKIIVIISIAVGIEGLVYIFKAGIDDVQLLLYPVSLVLASVVLVVGLGIYQRFSLMAEKRDV